MHYIDTSVLVSALTPEPRSSESEAWVQRNQGNAFMSDWGVTEFSSALSLKGRIGELSDHDRSLAQAGFDEITSGPVAVLRVTRPDFRVAASLCADPAAALRSGDALHLAVTRREGLVLVTRDKAMARAAELHGIDHRLLGEAT